MQFEYYGERIGGAAGGVIERLSALGLERWELCYSDGGYFIFKRQLLSEPPRMEPIPMKIPETKARVLPFTKRARKDARKTQDR